MWTHCCEVGVHGPMPLVCPVACLIAGFFLIRNISVLLPPGNSVPVLWPYNTNYNAHLCKIVWQKTNFTLLCYNRKQEGDVIHDKQDVDHVVTKRWVQGTINSVLLTLQPLHDPMWVTTFMLRSTCLWGGIRPVWRRLDYGAYSFKFAKYR